MQSCSEPQIGFSVVIPVHNGEMFLARTLAAIGSEAGDRPYEIIAIDDHSEDASRAVLEAAVARGMPLQVLRAEQRGMSAALNMGIRAARFPLICQIDQDVTLRPGWLTALLARMADPSVAAAQGCYQAQEGSSIWQRVMALDLTLRYAAISGDSDHVCTGTTIYRRSALYQVGLFDEALGYGNDNDLSYRLTDAGHRLIIDPAARSVHEWREGLWGYLSQQYGFGYGRLDLIAKHPRRIRGDAVSPWMMLLHVPVIGVACVLVCASVVAGLVGRATEPLWLTALALAGAAFAERVWAALRAWRATGDRAAWHLPWVHLLRDIAWVAAGLVWCVRRVRGLASSPSHSMTARQARRPATPVDPAAARVLGVIPAHNEAYNLPAVIDELRRAYPSMQLLVIDDGSTDGTRSLLRDLDVAWLGWSSRRGIGAAIRAGLMYASRLGFDVVVRVDADGQHSGDDIASLLRPIWSGDAEVVLGTRYARETQSGRWLVRLFQRGLAGCLSVATGGRVTDPTSGFCVFGPRAVDLLAEHHPDGYPEPELRLFLSRNGLRVMEVPVASRERLSGRTSLTFARVLLAAAHVALAIVVVPFRPVVNKFRD